MTVDTLLPSSVLEVSELRVRFGGVVALDGVSLEVHCNGCAGLIGPNGSGKTTLFNTVTGFVRSSSGSVRWNGKDHTGKSPQAMARTGVVRSFQQPMVFPSLTVMECLSTVTSSQDAAQELLELGELNHFGSASASALPYGVMRRLGVLMALAIGPALLMLDEPTSGLSSPEVGAMTRLLSSVRSRNIGTWIIDHNMRFMEELCDSLVVLNYGKVIASGKPADVLAATAVRIAYLEGEAEQPRPGNAVSNGG